MQYVSLCKNRRTLHTRMLLGILERLATFRADATAARNSDGLVSFNPCKHNADLEFCLCTVDVNNNYLLVGHGIGWRILIHEKAATGAHSNKTVEGHSQGDTPI